MTGIRTRRPRCLDAYWASCPVLAGSIRLIGCCFDLFRWVEEALQIQAAAHFTRPRHPSEHQLEPINILARQAADYLERKHAERTHQTIMRELHVDSTPNGLSLLLINGVDTTVRTPPSNNTF